MKQLSKNEKILGSVTAAVLLILAFKILILDSLRDKFDAAKEEISRLQLSRRKFSELKKDKDVLIKNQKQVERYTSLKGTEEERIAAVLSKVEAITRSAGLNIVDMNPVNTPGVKNGSAVYRVQLRAEADIEKLTNFIYNLENADMLFKVDKLSLSAKDESSRNLKIDANIISVPL